MKVVLLCSPGLSGFQRAVLESLLADEAIDVRACAIDTRRRPGAREKLARNLRQGRGGYVVVMAGSVIAGKLRRGGREPTEAFARVRGITTLAVADPSRPAALAELEPDALVLLDGFGIVEEPLLSLAPHGVISYHHGNMRRYRGMPPAFWELYNGESEIGVTVQRLSPGIDDGAPIVERSFPIGPRDSLKAVEKRIFNGSVEMMREALNALAAGATPERLERYGEVYTLPNLRQWLRFQALMARRRIGSPSSSSPSSPSARRRSRPPPRRRR